MMVAFSDSVSLFLFSNIILILLKYPHFPPTQTLDFRKADLPLTSRDRLDFLRVS